MELNAAAVPVAGNAELARAELALAVDGWPVFPLVARGKEPVIPRWKGGRGVYDATTDPEVIRHRRQQYPLANIGLAVPKGFVVVDLDSAEGLEVLRAAGNPLPASSCARTARGWHCWYSLPVDVQLRNGPTSLPHVEFKTVGGYVVAPPSVHPTGFVYAWMTPLTPENIAPAPEWILALAEPIGAARLPRPAGEWAELVRGPMIEGHRRETLLRLGGLLFRRLPAEVALELGRLWARTNCTPPIDPGEIDRILSGVAAAELRRRGGAS